MIKLSNLKSNRKILYRNKYATHFTSHQDPNREPRVYPDSMVSHSFRSEIISTPGRSLSFFHGTPREGAHNIREIGFRLDMKTDGATDSKRMQDHNTSENHYFTTNPQAAKNMAKYDAGALGSPAAVKAHLTPEYVRI